MVVNKRDRAQININSNHKIIHLYDNFCYYALTSVVIINFAVVITLVAFYYNAKLVILYNTHF